MGLTRLFYQATKIKNILLLGNNHINNTFIQCVEKGFRLLWSSNEEISIHGILFGSRFVSFDFTKRRFLKRHQIRVQSQKENIPKVKWSINFFVSFWHCSLNLLMLFSLMKSFFSAFKALCQSHFDQSFTHRDLSIQRVITHSLI